MSERIYAGREEIKCSEMFCLKRGFTSLLCEW